jgi:nitrate reductase beta subunit
MELREGGEKKENDNIMLLSHNTCEDRGYRICIESY